MKSDEYEFVKKFVTEFCIEVFKV